LVKKKIPPKRKREAKEDDDFIVPDDVNIDEDENVIEGELPKKKTRTSKTTSKSTTEPCVNPQCDQCLLWSEKVKKLEKELENMKKT
jgi:hypothetical protein